MSAEIEALTRRVSELETALKPFADRYNWQVAHGGPKDNYTEVSTMHIHIAADVYAGAIKATPQPKPAPLSLEEYMLLWDACTTGNATDAQWKAYRAEVERRKTASDATTQGKDERAGKK